MLDTDFEYLEQRWIKMGHAYMIRSVVPNSLHYGLQPTSSSAHEVSQSRILE